MTIADVLQGAKLWHVECGDAADVLKTLPDNSIDAIVCDPPAGINFMQMDFDSDRGGRDEWIAWLASIMREALRAVKPGGHAFVWSLPRTQHWTATAIEDAGWQIRDVIFHLFSTGFPKSLSISKAIDKAAGAVREIGAPIVYGDGHVQRSAESIGYGGSDPAADTRTTTKPCTDDARTWDGWGSALKPSAEGWILARKPFKGSLVRNVLAHGTGGLNIDASRVPHANAADLEAHAAGVAAIKARGGSMEGSWKNSSDLAGANDVTTAGRWPAHTIFSHSSGCERRGTKKVKAAPSWNDNRPDSLFTGGETSPVHHTDGDGFETVEDWACQDGCPVALLDEQSGASSGKANARSDERQTFANDVYGGGLGVHDSSNSYTDEGGASRFFTTLEADPFIYQSKAPTAEKERGLDGFLPKTVSDGRTKPIDTPRQRGQTKRLNTHPTAKSVALMRWLCRLITPPGGIVIDPFAGSGSTGVACSAEGFRFMGIDQSEEYCAIARARITGDNPLFNRAGGSR